MLNRAKEFTNIYIKNFGPDVDSKTLTEIFSKFGPTLSVRVMTDERGNSRGFGFVSFEKHIDAKRAVDELNRTEMSGRLVYVGRAQKRRERQAELKRRFEQLKQEHIMRHQGVNLYVKNLSDSVDSDLLLKEFSPYGNITSAKVMLDGGRSKGFGFVCFSCPEEATRAITEMNCRIIGSKPIYVSLAQRKEERQAHLIHQNMMRRASFHRQQPLLNPLDQNHSSYHITQPQPGTQWDTQNISPQFSLTHWTPSTAAVNGELQHMYTPEDNNHRKFTSAPQEQWAVQQVNEALAVYQSYQPMNATPISFTSPVILTA